jgi:uncharacterized protein involved in exopolysaccharide biosynthesis
MQEHSSFKSKGIDESIDIREQFDKYFIHWRWFVLSMVIALVCAFLYLRYTIPQYSATATIMVKDERKGGLQSEMTAKAQMRLLESKSKKEKK